MKKVNYTIPVMSGGSESGFETTLYRYNNVNQLIAEQLGASGLSGAEQEKEYRYDRRGNLIAVNQGEELLKQFSFDSTNRMSGSAGNVDGIWKQAAYQYNGLGQRVGQEIWNPMDVVGRYGQNMAATSAQPATLPQTAPQSIRYTLDLTKQYHNLLHLGDTQNGKDQTFYWDGNVVSMDEEGEESFYLQDDLGSPMELLGAEGGRRESYAFDEFGVPLNLQEQLQPFGFTGYQTDVAGGLYFAQARRYDATARRFVSEDKIKGFADAPFTLNPYSYCWNKPMELADLNGLAPTAGVVAEVSEELNGQTHPSAPTAGVTSDIGAALSGGGYSGYTSCDNGSDITSEEVKEYLEKYLNQIVNGNFTEDVTLLGVIIEITLAVFELDAPMDVRDLVADIYLGWKGEQSGWWVVLDLVAFVLVVEAIRYSDDVVVLAKKVDWKKIWKDISDSVTGDLRKMSDNFSEIWEKGSKKLSEFEDDIQTWWKKVMGGDSKSINGLKIINGKVDGKIPLDEYNTYREMSIHNVSSDTMTLGKFDNGGATSYINMAGDTTYFDLRNEWDNITNIYGLDEEGRQMFEYFNKPALDDAVSAGKDIRLESIGMQLNDTEKMAMEVSKTVRENLKGKVLSTEIYDVVDDADHRQFKIRFLAYDYFIVVFQYEQDIIGCAIEQGNNIYIPLVKGQHCYSSENLNVYFNAVSEELELRIPDKFLKNRGWL